MEYQPSKASQGRKKYKSNFLENLFAMLDEDQFTEFIYWNEDGMSFQIPRPLKFAENVLPKFFKHANLSSFNRQLNMYNFVRTSMNSQEKVSFSHPMFQRGRGDLISQIFRKKVINKKPNHQTLIQQEESEETYSEEPYMDYQPQNKKLFIAPLGEELRSVPTSQSFSSPREALNAEIVQMSNTLASLEALCSQTISQDREWASMNDFFKNKFQATNQREQQSDRAGLTNNNQMPPGFSEFRIHLEKLLEFDKIDEHYDKLFENTIQNLQFSESQQRVPFRNESLVSSFGNNPSFLSSFN